VHVGRLGDNPAAPLVESRRTRLENRPWKDLQSLRGNVEAEFLRPLYLGETLAPFRLLPPLLAVIPWDEQANRLLDSQAAQNAGYLNLARWMANAEQLWQRYGRGRRTLLEQMDYYGQLSAQFPVTLVRVVYGASGTLPVAAVLRDGSAVVGPLLTVGRRTTLSASLTARQLGAALPTFRAGGSGVRVTSTS
jgi:hypothetical protein